MTDKEFLKFRSRSLWIFFYSLSISICLFIIVYSVYDYDLMCSIMISILLLYLLSMWWYSDVYIYEDKIVIKYPLRIKFARSKTIFLSDVKSIKYIAPYKVPASLDIKYVKLINKEGYKEKIYKKNVNLNIMTSKSIAPMLHFFASKDIAVEIRGTENNSINDLK